MKNTSILFLLLLSVSTIAFSQNSITDSLELELDVHSKEDSNRVKLLNELAYAYYTIDSNKAFQYIEESGKILEQINFRIGKAKHLFIKGITQGYYSNHKNGFEYCTEALEIYESIHDESGIAECKSGMGVFFFHNNDFQQAIDNFSISHELYVEIGNRQKEAVILRKIGNSYHRLGKFDIAIKFLNKSVKISEEDKNEKATYPTLNIIGSIFAYQGKFELALRYFNESLAICNKFNDSLNSSRTICNIGIVNYGLHNYNKAIIFYKKALEYQKSKDNKDEIALLFNNMGLSYKAKNDFDSAYFYLNSALEFYNNENNLGFASRCLNNIGEIYQAQNQQQMALEYFLKAKNKGLEVDDRLSLCNSYLGIAKTYKYQKKYDKALENAKKSKALSYELKTKNYQRDILLLLSEIFEATGKHKASLKHYKLYKAINDSIFNKENIQKITALEYEYKYQQQLDSADFRALQLSQTAKTVSEDLEVSQKNLLWSVVVSLLVFFFLIAIIFFLKFRNVKSTTKNIVIEQKLLRSQMTPHFIFNSLSVLQGMILNKEEKKSVTYLSKFSKLLRMILENSREKTVSLSQELNAIENYLALQNLADDSYKYSILVERNIDISLFEIPAMLIQPFAENAIEHAFSDNKEERNIDIRLDYSNKKLTCTIIDNGVGINSQKQILRKDKKSLSTAITTERLKILAKDFKIQGSVKIEDRQKYNENGTIVTLEIPYKLHKN
ncbi:MAG: tetratricopeptide repeat protein [Crocinitomicaceae bacterium]